MFVWILHGTQEVRTRRGVVADVCRACRAIRPFLVIDHFHQDHMYGVGYGTGVHVGTTQRCRQCGRTFPFREAAYDDVLAVSAAAGEGALDRVLRATTKELAALRDLADRMRAHSKEPPYRAAAGEDANLLPQALDLLEQLMLRGVAVKALYERLTGWDGMSADDRRAFVGQLRWRVDEPADA